MTHPSTHQAPGLEYPLIFGLPGNKTEILDGKMRVVWPLADSARTGLAFERWVTELERWRRAVREPLDGSAPGFCVGGVTLRRHIRRVEMRVPMDVDTFLSIYGSFWEPGLWGQSDDPSAPGYDSIWRYGDLRMDLWSAFGEVTKKAGGRHCSGDVMVTPDTNLFLDAYYYAPDAPMHLIGGDYPEGPPRAVAQVLCPATREADRGPRLSLLHRAGVAHVWLLDPLLETVEVLGWQAPGYASEGLFGTGDELRPAFCPGLSLPVAPLFRDQGWPRGGEDEEGGEREEGAGPEWLIPPERRIGLEHLLLLGHPCRRYEIWRDSAPCVLAFGSPVEARERLRHLLNEAAAWTGSTPALLQLTGDVEAARVGPFQFTRRENRVHLDLAVDPAHYRAVLELMGDSEVWDDDEEDDDA